MKDSFSSRKTKCSEKLSMESPSSVTKPVNSMYMRPTHQVANSQPRSKLAPRQPTVSNSLKDGNKDSKRDSQLGEMNSSPTVESPQSQAARIQPLPAADEILTYKPDTKRTMIIDASVAAYFADMFRNVKKSLS